MKHSIVTYCGLFFKKITGVKDISLLRKDLKKNIGRQIYKKKYTTEDVISCMESMGMKQGSVVCVHASMKEFYNYKGTAMELIRAIIDCIGDEGTLIMPAYPNPNDMFRQDYVFDAKNDKTYAGYLAETFRTMPNVRRSINVQHSVCAYGKYAEWLTRDHNKCKNCWDENSPWYRMTTLNALVFTLGLASSYIGTFDHCVEGVLYKEHPYWAQFFNVTHTFHYYDEDGKVESYDCKAGRLECRTHENNLIKHFDASMMRKKRLSNLLIKCFRSAPCLKKMIELGRQGITMYYFPLPKEYKF